MTEEGEYLCGSRHAPLVLKPAIPQHEHAIESVKDIFVAGNRNYGGTLIDGSLRKRSMTICARLESSAAVGSSARMMRGRLG